MKRVMVDLETPGKFPGCGIFSIGAVEFTMQGRKQNTQSLFGRSITCLMTDN